MFFVLDHDVDVAVGRMLRQAGHRCVSIGAVGLATAPDDVVSVFADNHQGVLITHDVELISRRRRNTFGRHVLMSCAEWDAADLLRTHLAEIHELLERKDAVVLRISKNGVTEYPTRWD